MRFMFPVPSVIDTGNTSRLPSTSHSKASHSLAPFVDFYTLFLLNDHLDYEEWALIHFIFKLWVNQFIIGFKHPCL